MTRTSRNVMVGLLVTVGLAGDARASAWSSAAHPAGSRATDQCSDQVLEWNQIFIDTLIATNTANSSSQRLGAIVHTAIFDAYNGIERRYTPIFVHDRAPEGSSRRAAVIAAAYTALVGLFPSRQAALDASYAASLAALERPVRRRQPIAHTSRSCAERIERGIAWGTAVAQAVLAWRATDGFSASYPPFTGGTAVGQWRPTPPAFGPMSAQGLAFTEMFVLANNTQFDPGPPRTSRQRHLRGRFQRRQGAGSQRPDRRAPRTRRRSLPSGKATPASTGIRPRTRSHGPTTCRCQTPTGCSRS